MAILEPVYRAIQELREAAGDVESKLRAVLGPRGWLKQLDDIPDASFRSLCRKGLEALIDGGAQRVRRQSTKGRLEQRAKAKASVESPPDLFLDSIVGWPPERLITKLHHETYYVASLGRDVDRHELLTELSALAELRAATRDLRREAEELQKWYANDEAIFAELLRQLSGAAAA